MNNSFVILGTLRSQTKNADDFLAAKNGRHYSVAIIDGSNKALFKSKRLQEAKPSLNADDFVDHSIAKSEYVAERNGKPYQGVSYILVSEQRVPQARTW
jgi:hypothetical protein